MPHRAMHRRIRRGVVVVLGLMGSLIQPASTTADVPARSRQSDTTSAVLPDMTPAWGWELHAGTFIPLTEGSLCPEGSKCMFQSGGGIGGSGEYRWPFGLALAATYDIWFLEGGGVYELGIFQQLGAALRYYFMQSHRLHPYIGFGATGILFGDAARLGTGGVGVQGLFGVELELSSVLALTACVRLHAFLLDSFVTPRDRTHRGDWGEVYQAMSIQIGIRGLGGT
jgi:hypothetical protein